MIEKDIKKHLDMSFLKGEYNKLLLDKLLLIKSLEICNLAESKGNYDLAKYKYKIINLLNILK